MAWIRNESGSIVPFRRSILPNKPFLATLRCLSLSLSLPFVRAANSLWNQVVHVRRWRRRRRLGDRESGRDNIFPRLDLIKSAPVRRDERGEPHGSPALQTSKQKKGYAATPVSCEANAILCLAFPRFLSSSSPPLPPPEGKRSSRLHAWLARRRCDSSFDRRREWKPRGEACAAVSLWLRGRESPASDVCSLDKKMIKRREGFGMVWIFVELLEEEIIL